MAQPRRNRSAVDGDAAIGCPLTVQVDHCLAWPLRREAGVPGTLTTLMQVQGIVFGSMSGSANFFVHILQVNATFHGENWSCFTLNGGSRDVLPIIVPSFPCVYSGQFTKVWQMRDDVWAICPEMQAFHIRLFDRTGTHHFKVYPFTPSEYCVSVHPSATLVFTNSLHQMLL